MLHWNKCCAGIKGRINEEINDMCDTLFCLAYQKY